MTRTQVNLMKTGGTLYGKDNKIQEKWKAKGREGQKREKV